MLDSEFDLLLDELPAVIFKGLLRHIVSRAFPVRGSTNVADGDGDAVAGEVELEFLYGAGKKFATESLALSRV